MDFIFGIMAIVMVLLLGFLFQIGFRSIKDYVKVMYPKSDEPTEKQLAAAPKCAEDLTDEEWDILTHIEHKDALGASSIIYGDVDLRFKNEREKEVVAKYIAHYNYMKYQEILDKKERRQKRNETAGIIADKLSKYSSED